MLVMTYELTTYHVAGHNVSTCTRINNIFKLLISGFWFLMHTQYVLTYCVLIT